MSTSDVVKAQEKVLGGAQDPKTVNEEPLSGVKGAGTADEPYDQGNQAEQTANPETEPVAGQRGKGTADEPYDQGNQPGKRVRSYSSFGVDDQEIANLVQRTNPLSLMS